MAKSKASKADPSTTKAEKKRVAGEDTSKHVAEAPRLPEAGIDDAWLKKNTAKLKGEAPSLGVPLAVFSAEAQDCASFLVQYWEPEVENGKVLRPGLKSLVVKSQPEKFGLHIGSEIIELRRRADDAQTEYPMASKAEKNAKGLMEKAHGLLDVWTGALEWYLDDGVEDDKDAKFRAVADANDNVDTIDGAASALKDYGALVRLYADELDGVLDFDPTSVDEGAKLREQLLEISDVLEDNPDARRALAKRNDLLSLLLARVSAVRTAARLRFTGKHVAIARKVTSSHQRRARAEARRKEAAKLAGK